MSKYVVTALILALCAGFAIAGSLKVPWFVDSPVANPGQFPQAAGGAETQRNVGLVFLTNNSDTALNCTIQYYNAKGQELSRQVTANAAAVTAIIGWAPNANTFTIPAHASTAFRPVADDTPGVAGQMEPPLGISVPNRGTTLLGGAADTSNHLNGSILITWQDADVSGAAAANPTQALQGAYWSFVGDPTGKLVSYGHLLPPGF